MNLEKLRPTATYLQLMKYNFDEHIDRRNTASYKWDSDQTPDMLPMWVADMDFRTAPAIIDALARRVENGVFGYTKVPDLYYIAAIDWFVNRHATQLSREWFIYTSGVVPAISAVIKALTSPGDGVIVQTPVYNCFFSSIRNNRCKIVENPLIYADLGNGLFSYRIDFDGLDRLCADPSNRVLLLCNPHNPGGRVWTKEEITRLVDICHKNNVIVVSDEIHCELILPPNNPYTPLLSLETAVAHGDIMCFSPSKAFNIAGLQIANIVCPDSDRLAKIDRAINDNEVCDVNPFGVDALIAAYTLGGEWLDNLCSYLANNYAVTLEFFRNNFPMLTVSRLEATYLPWIDVRKLGMPSEEIEQQLKKENVWINAGTMYGTEGYIRLNIATRRELLIEGLERIGRGLRTIISQNA